MGQRPPPHLFLLWRQALEDALAAKHAEAAALRSQLDHLSGALARQRTPQALGAQCGVTASPLGAIGFGR